MQLPIGWLAAYVSPPPLDALLDRLTEIGHMVDGPVQPAPGGPVIPLEIRQNRPDCLSVYGLAREVAAAFGLALAPLELGEAPAAGSTLGGAHGALHLLRLRGVRLAPLPGEILGRLEQCGLRPSHPLVDLANYVTLELGQPLHVYAAGRVDPASMLARPGRPGERLELIGGATAQLSADDLVVADGSGPLALASVLGGSASAVGEGAAEIVVEAGIFSPHLVRRTARRHGLSTEASLRGSKLLPPALPGVALRRLLALLTMYGHVESAELWRPAEMADPAPTLRLAHREIRRLGGLEVTPGEAAAALAALGLEAALEDGGATIVAAPPWWRSDLAHPVDLIEEVVRMAGYAQVPAVALPPVTPGGPELSAWGQEEQVRALLGAWGYDEVILDSFLLERAGGLADSPGTLRVENAPAGSDALRPALLPNILAAARHLPLLAPRRQLCELGHVFRRGPDGPEEARAAAWLTLRGAGPASWGETAGDDLYRLKAEALAVLGALGVQVAAEEAGGLPFPFLGAEGVRLLGADGRAVGVVGALNHRAYGTTPAQAAYGAELRLPDPAAGAGPAPRRARRPAERVDLSAAVGPGVTAARLRGALAEALGADALELALIDVYAGPGAGAPESLTFRIVYDGRRGPPRAVWEELRQRVEAALDVSVRG